jgi:Xaa-Pro aminopeptidase
MTEKTQQNSKEMLPALQASIATEELEGYLVPMPDEFQCEYVPEHAKRLKKLAGFSGSAGIAVVLKDKALMLSDQRYTERLKKQVDATKFETSDKLGSGKALQEWILKNVTPGSKIGYDPMLHTEKEIKKLEKALRAQKIKLEAVEGNLVDPLWTDRPPVAASQVFLTDDATEGRTAAQKRAVVGETIRAQGGKAAIVGKADSLNWLLNIRGRDVKHTPLALSNAIVHEDGRVDWFIEPSRVSPDISAHLGKEVTVRPPGEMTQALIALAQAAKEEEKPVLVDSERVPVWFNQILEKAGAKIEDNMDPCIEPRACKTLEEIAAIKEAHLRDGVAMVRFLRWFDEEAPKGHLTEKDVADKLEEFCRLDQDMYELSFPTIAGWNANGADIHRELDEENNTLITPPGQLLLDSGRQYQNKGTTDITRVIVVGKPTDGMKEDFTLVLMGHIDLAMTEFPEGTRGVHLDVIARKHLWDAGKDYGHGTGHGVGKDRGVHEDASGISKGINEKGLPLKLGMLLSNEPGFYPGDYGIRIENLQFVVEKGIIANGPGKTVPMYGFEVVTMCPIDRRLIVPEMMTKKQLNWLNNYHEKVYQSLAPRLNEAEKEWLHQATAPLKKNLILTFKSTLRSIFKAASRCVSQMLLQANGNDRENRYESVSQPARNDACVIDSGGRAKISAAQIKTPENNPPGRSPG